MVSSSQDLLELEFTFPIDQIIVLLGKRLDGEKVDHDIESKHLRQLAEVNTRILYYDQLLANAETLYADFIAKNSSLASLETLINSIG